MNSVSTHSAMYYPEENAKLSARPVAEVKLKLAHHFCPNFLGSRWLNRVGSPFLDFYLEYHWIPPAPSLRRVWIFLGAQQEWAAAAALAAPSATAGEFNARHPSTLHTLRRKRADLGKKSTFSREFTQNMSDRDKPRWFWQSPKRL